VGPREAEFLAASRHNARRRRLTRRGLLAGLPLLLGLAYGAVALQIRAERNAQIAVHLFKGEAELARARGLAARAEALRAQALSRFDAGDVADGERRWTEVLKEAEAARAAFKAAGSALETALLIDNQRPDLRRRFAEVLYEQALLAGREHRVEQREDLLSRLAHYDDGGALRQRLFAPARLVLDLRPAAAIEIRRYESEGRRRRLGPPLPAGTTELPPASYRITLRAPGRPEVRYPVLLFPGETHRLALTLPRAVPAGYVYVPPGRALFGSADDENWRRTGLTAQPLHEVRTAGYLIGRTEVTMAEWLAYLRDLGPAERRRRRPHAGPVPGAIDLIESPPGRFTLVLTRPGQPPYTAREGERLRYPGRDRRAEQDWLRFPALPARGRAAAGRRQPRRHLRAQPALVRAGRGRGTPRLRKPLRPAGHGRQRLGVGALGEPRGTGHLPRRRLVRGAYLQPERQPGRRRGHAAPHHHGPADVRHGTGRLILR
jgi:hypothetical protein